MPPRKTQVNELQDDIPDISTKENTDNNDIGTQKMQYIDSDVTICSRCLKLTTCLLFAMKQDMAKKGCMTNIISCIEYIDVYDNNDQNNYNDNDESDLT